MNSPKKSVSVLVQKSRKSIFNSPKIDVNKIDPSDIQTNETEQNKYRVQVSSIFKHPKLKFDKADGLNDNDGIDKELDLKLNTIHQQYYTTLGKLTADANERMSVVKDLDILKSEVSEEELIAVEMLKEWQRTKKGREQKTNKLVNNIQDAIRECETQENDSNKIYHHQIKENKWTEMSLNDTETKYFKKKVHSKKTCIHIDVRSLKDGALLSVYVSHETDNPSIANCQWQTKDPTMNCRININDIDNKFVTDKYYYIAVRSETATVGITKFKIRINAIQQSKKNKESNIGRGVKQRLEYKLKQIRANDDEMLEFQKRLINIKERHKIDLQTRPNEKVKENTANAGDLLWSSHRNELYRNNKWSEKEDVLLLELLHRFKDVGNKKWDLIAMIMKNTRNGGKTARDCNERAAILKRQRYTDKEEIHMVSALSKKKVMQEEKLKECEHKLEQLKIKDAQRVERQLQIKRQRQLQPLQKKWIFILETVARIQFWNENLSNYRQAQREMKQRVRAAVTIQKWMRKKMEMEREWKAHLHCNMLRSILRVCVLNREINKYNRSAEIIKHFMETQTGSFSPISVVISNFRNSVLTIQRFARLLYAKKWARITVLRQQFDEYIDELVKQCKGNVMKERRYKFSDKALNKTIEEFYHQKSDEHNRRMRIWVREVKKQSKKQPSANMVEMIMGKDQKKKKKNKLFYLRKPLFGMKIDTEELDALMLKAEKFHKQEKHS